jgi:hypothetical protein
VHWPLLEFRMLARFRSSPWSQALHVAFACAAALLGIVLVARAMPGYFPQNWSVSNEYDALVDWKAARHFWRGINPYSPLGLELSDLKGMGHPPTTAFWYLPFAELPKETIAELTSVSMLFLVPLHVYLCAKELSFPAPLAVAWLATGLLLCTSWLRYHFSIIQLSEHIAFLYVLAWWLLRRRRDVSAGLCLGAATSLKLFPGLLVLMLLLGRRFRAFVAACGTYLAIASVMTIAYGPRSWLDFFQQQGPISERWMGSVQNSSLHGLLTRLISPACEGPVTPTRTATQLAVGVSVCLLGLAAWSSRSPLQRARESDPRAIDVPFALFVLLSAFLNAWAWEHYFVLVIQPIMILAAVFAAAWRQTFRRWCDEEAGGRSLLRVSLAASAAAAGLAAVFWSLRLEFREKEHLRKLWLDYHDPFYHSHMHILEAANVLPWVVPIALCFGAIALGRRLYFQDSGARG